MSTAADALAEGFSALVATAGETLTFGSASVSALVNRTPDRVRRQNAVDFQPQDASEIQIARGALDPVPPVGTVFTDAFGYKHRVLTVKNIGHVTTFNCRVSS